MISAPKESGARKTDKVWYLYKNFHFCKGSTRNADFKAEEGKNFEKVQTSLMNGPLTMPSILHTHQSCKQRMSLTFFFKVDVPNIVKNFQLYIHAVLHYFSSRNNKALH